MALCESQAVMQILFHGPDLGRCCVAQPHGSERTAERDHSVLPALSRVPESQDVSKQLLHSSISQSRIQYLFCAPGTQLEQIRTVAVKEVRMKTEFKQLEIQAWSYIPD